MKNLILPLMSFGGVILTVVGVFALTGIFSGKSFEIFGSNIVNPDAGVLFLAVGILLFSLSAVISRIFGKRL